MQNVSEGFKTAIASPSPEFESRITFPNLVLDDYQVKSIELNSLLVSGNDFEIGTAPMDMVKVEFIEDTGDEWGRNYATAEKISSIYKVIGGGSHNTNHAECPNGFHSVNDRDRTGIFRLDNVITENGYWTLSFDIKGSQSVVVYHDISICGSEEVRVFTNATNTWETRTITINVTNYNDEVNYVDFRPSWAYLFVRNIKLEKGPVATPWTPAPEDYANYDYKNKECDIELGLTLPDESVEYVSIGKFTVENAVRKNNTITLDCVDRMYKAEKDYVSDLMYPTTILSILQSACDQAGIVLATTTFANSNYIVPNEPVYEGVTCRKVFAQVAELAGGYAKINRLGQLEIVTLGNESVRDITKDHYFDLKINEVAEASIDKVIVKVGEETATKGDGENIYTIVDNMFVQDPNNVVDALYSVLKNVSYTACTLKWQGDFSLDLGDKVIVDGNDTYVLNRKLTYTGGLREDYSAPAKSNIEKNSTGKGSLLLDIENVKTQVRVLSGEISQTIERVENLVVGANNRLFDSQTEIPFGFNSGSGTIQLFRDQVHPYYKVTSSQSIDLFAAFPDSQFAEPLGELGEVTISLDVMVDVDRTVTIDGKDFGVKANRWTRIHVTKNFTESNTTRRLRVRNPFSRKWTRDIFVGTKLIDSLFVEINILYYRNLKVEKGNVPTGWTLTPEELEANVSRFSSEIKQLADSISMKVSKNNIISEINQTAEMIKILAERIALEGLVTANDNFKILPDGSMEAKNGSFSGTVTGTTINGSVINGTEINGGEINGAVFSTQPTEQEYGVTIDRGKIRATDSQSNIIFNLAATTVTEGIPYRGGRVSAKQAVVLTPDEGSNMITILPNQTYLHGKTTVAGDFNVSGSKSRIVKTHNYGEVLHYALESPTPTFMDIGHGIIDIDGLCYIDIESIFSETIDLVSDYHIQLTKYGEGDIWVSKKQNNFFIVEGSPGLKFAWEIKAKQKGYSNERLEHYSRPVKEETDYVLLAQEYLAEYEKELIE